MADIVHDLIIVGGGPAGLSAAIYASRAMLDTLTIEQASPGGQVLLATEVDNYPGLSHVPAFDLADAMESQARELGAQIVRDTISAVDRDPDMGEFTILGVEAAYRSRAVLVATGATPRRAGFAGEDRFAGHGVSYCASCDAMFYRDKEVLVVGGGSTAVSEAEHLARLAGRVTLVVRGKRLRAQRAAANRIESNERIAIRYQTSIVSVEGGELPSSVTFRDNATGRETVRTFDEGSVGIFVAVGHRPATDLLGSLVDVSPEGGVLTDERMRTKTPGLFCAGDVREKPLRQIVTAASDGAIAASTAAEFLREKAEDTGV